jgi:hypothetical protein
MLVWLALLSQEPAAPTPPPAVPKLEFSGKPIVAPFACDEEQLTAAGVACSEADPCPVFLELAALESLGNNRLLVAGNLHSNSATFSSILLLSEDGGKTWIEAHERLPQTALEAVQFADFSTGWIAGQTLTTLPRDPFFLVTADGGKTWRKRPVYDESRVAVIDSFHFESRTDGWMVIDRSRAGEPNQKYESYETKTGGDTWMLREASATPIKPKKPRTTADSGFRLRADAASKTYRVEQRMGQRWTLAASFAIRLPDCAPVEKEREPPPEPEPPAPPPVKPPKSKPSKP